MDKNCISALIAVKTIEAIYGKVQDSYEVTISVDEYDDLTDSEQEDCHAHFKDDESDEVDWYEHHIDRQIWFGKISNDCGNIKDREEILKSLDVETVRAELQMRYDALYELQNYNLFDYDQDTNISFEVVKEIVMWTRNGFIS